MDRGVMRNGYDDVCVRIVYICRPSRLSNESRGRGAWTRATFRAKAQWALWYRPRRDVISTRVLEASRAVFLATTRPPPTSAHHVRNVSCQASLLRVQPREAARTFNHTPCSNLPTFAPQSSITEWVEILTSSSYDGEAYDG